MFTGFEAPFCVCARQKISRGQKQEERPIQFHRERPKNNERVFSPNGWFGEVKVPGKRNSTAHDAVKADETTNSNCAVPTEQKMIERRVSAELARQAIKLASEQQPVMSRRESDMSTSSEQRRQGATRIGRQDSSPSAHVEDSAMIPGRVSNVANLSKNDREMLQLKHEKRRY